MANILSIQSGVAYGHVGNAAAMLPLQRLGHEVWPIYTTQYSCHGGYGQFRGRAFPAAHIGEVVAGLAEHGFLASCDAVLSGYLGTAATGAAVLDAVARAKAANPRAFWCCDPVMGDDPGGLFVSASVAKFFAEKALSAADILTPNCFELERLTGARVVALGDAIDAALALVARGPGMVAVTSLRPPAVPHGRIGALLVTRGRAWRVHTPELRLDPQPHGSGDAFAALLLGRLLAGASPARALGRAVSGLFAVLRRAGREGLAEMPLVAAQRELLRPPILHPVERLSLRSMTKVRKLV